MPANRTQRPSPGTTLVLPRVTDAESTQRAIDQLASVIRQLQAGLELFGDDRNGRVPASGGGVVKFLRADQTWAIPAGGGGGGAVTDGDYGDVIVSSSGAVWTVDALPESRISGLVADLAAKVPTSRTITTTAPLTINGGASADLSANDTIAIGSFGTAASGIVSASGGATRLLLGDNTWITLEQLLLLLNIGLGQFGDGSDGAAVMDGSAAVAGCTLAGSTYTGLRNTSFTTLGINNGIIFKPSGFPVNVRVLLTNNGLITGSGGDANTFVSVGAAPWVAGTSPLPPGFAGGIPGNGAALAGFCPQEFDVTSAPGGAAGTPPAAGTAGGIGHGGGGGGSYTNQGGQGGVVVLKPASAGSFRQYWSATSAQDGQTVLDAAFTCGSAGGGGANANASTSGGCGGGSGGWVVVSAFAFAGSGLYQSHGGAGSAGSVGTLVSGGGGGGGAGGAGGVFVIVCGSGAPPTPTVTGGLPGTGGAIGTGTISAGAAGAAGGDGRTVIFT